MQSELLGMVFALGSAVSVAGSRSVLSRPLIRADPAAASFFSIATGFGILLAMEFFEGQTPALLYLSPTILIIFVVVGLIHHGFARQLFFVGTKELGANISAPVIAVAQVLVALILALVILGEAITPVIAAGAALILFGVAVMEGHAAAAKRGGSSRRGYASSVGNGLVTGFTPILVAYGLSAYPFVNTALLIAYGGACIYYLVLLGPGKLVSFVKGLQRGPLALFLASSVLAVTSMSLRYVALIDAPVVLVAPVLTSQVMFTPFMTARLSKEYEVFTGRTLSGIVICTVGLFVLSLYGFGV